MMNANAILATFISQVHAPLLPLMAQSSANVGLLQPVMPVEAQAVDMSTQQHYQHHPHHAAQNPHTVNETESAVALDLTATRRPATIPTTRKTPSPYNGSNYSDLSPGHHDANAEVPEVKYDPLIAQQYNAITMFAQQNAQNVEQLQEQLKQQYPSPNESLHESRAMPTVYAAPPASQSAHIVGNPTTTTNTNANISERANAAATAAFAAAGYMMPHSMDFMQQMQMHMHREQPQHHMQRHHMQMPYDIQQHAKQHPQHLAAAAALAAVTASTIAVAGSAIPSSTTPDIILPTNAGHQQNQSARSSTNASPNQFAIADAAGPVVSAISSSSSSNSSGRSNISSSSSSSANSSTNNVQQQPEHSRVKCEPSGTPTTSTTRPFKGLPRDPQTIAAQFTAKDAMLSGDAPNKYVTFRKRMLEQIHHSHGGCPTVSNPKMRRTKPSAAILGTLPSFAGDSEAEASDSGSLNNGASNNAACGNVKDAAYLERRQKNNAAAKKSRDRRRIKEDEITIRNVYLEKENATLREKYLLLISQLKANNLVPITLQVSSETN